MSNKENKIIIHKLQDEVESIREENGLIKSARILTQRYPDIEGGISHMCIKRYEESRDKTALLNTIEAGRDPLEELNHQFRVAIKKNTRKLNKLVDTSNLILEQALKEGTISDKTRALKEVRDSLGQEIKNWTALRQYGVIQSKHIGDINFKKEQDIRVMINIWTDEIIKLRDALCEECRKKVKLENIIKFK